MVTSNTFPYMASIEVERRRSRYESREWAKVQLWKNELKKVECSTKKGEMMEIFENSAQRVSDKQK